MHNRTGVNVDATTSAAPQRLDVANLTPQQRGGLAHVSYSATDTPNTGVATVNLTAAKNNLSFPQRTGRACITCGATGTILKPAGTLLDIDVVECENHQWERANADNPPTWLTGPCPTWCIAEHRGSDHPDDRNHHSTNVSVSLKTMDYQNHGTPDEPRFVPLELMADLFQQHLQAEPRVVLNDTSDKFADYLSLDEAERFANHLLELVLAARHNWDLPDPE
ncbi:hypothetical protein IMZ11_25560 [Microtetraspora sp. AC03309]|uniref:DUF6907 domain-containing protein n=1 Tax=Microtetraspora sp. AC03309 TaxID=2779376 RepID=UPI001E39C89C|nr:hypothetical protein [Microtetraspora sp. AC03309]MCC5578998.1 hypothetical protein [Microtetraspora sp. AC03309]